MLANKYTLTYYKIINRARNRIIDDYTEIHHIIPKSLGGSNDKINLVKLTAREHFICHLLLTKMYDGNEKNKMIYAVWAMINLKNEHQLREKVTSRIYQVLRIQYAKTVSDSLKGKPGRKHDDATKQKLSDSKIGKKRDPMSPEAKEKLSKSMQGKNIDKKRSEEVKKMQSIIQTGITRKPHTEETKKKLSNANKGKKIGPMPTETKEKLSKSLKGKQKTEEHCKNISKSLKGRAPTNEERQAYLISMEKGKSSCEYCGKRMILGNYIRWHGNNCKLKSNK